MASVWSAEGPKRSSRTWPKCFCLWIFGFAPSGTARAATKSLARFTAAGSSLGGLDFDERAEVLREPEVVGANL